MNQYNINPDCGVPIYRQLVDALRADIRSGALAHGTKLDTVRELSDQLGVAPGTVKRAYDELEQESMIEMAQGRGTFVAFRERSEQSRKEQAILAIDQLLDQLEALNLSQAEAEIFIDLKLRERKSRRRALHIALVECNREVLTQVSGQVQQLGASEVSPLLLEDVLAYPYQIGDDVDLVVTTVRHAAQLEAALPDSRKLSKVALSMHPRMAVQIAMLRADERVGILCQSERFAALLQSVFKTYAAHVQLREPRYFDAVDDLQPFLDGCDAVLVPEEFETYCTPDSQRQLRRFAERCKLIPCAYQIDQGSAVYLEERIAAILHEKAPPTIG